MDASPPGKPAAAAQPRPILRRPTIRRGSSDYQAYSPPQDRRQSDSAVAARRGEPIPRLRIPSRPSIAPHSASGRSVSFGPDGPFALETLPSAASAPISATPGTPTYPLIPRRPAGPSQLFGFSTQFRPLWLLGLANVSTALFGMGAVIVQRAVWPVPLYGGLNPHGPTVLPGGEAGHGTAFGGPTGGKIGGSLMVAAGTLGAVTASVLFLQDGRRLNRTQNPQAPNYRRTHRYFAVHQLGIAILVTHRFSQEAFRSALPPVWSWAIGLPGGVGQGLFAITQAQSFSSSELANGRMPIRRRAEISAAARALVASYIVLGAILGTPNASAYLREGVRSIAAVSTTVAYSLPLATARMAGPAADIPVGSTRYRGDWSAMQALVLYFACRLVGTLGGFWMARSTWPAAANMPETPPPTGPNSQLFKLALRTAAHNLPPPLPYLAADPHAQAGAALLMAGCFLGCCYAFLQFHRDASPPVWLSRTYFGAAATSVALGLTYRMLQERAKALADFNGTWEAVAPGVVAHALAFVVIPEMFARSELQMPHHFSGRRYQAIEAGRAIGSLGFYIWAAMNATLGFPPVFRQVTLWLATSGTLLAMALPNADTMRAARGATPSFERGDPFDALGARMR